MLLLILFFLIGSLSSATIDYLSTDDAVKSLEIIDQIMQTTDSDQAHQLKSQFCQLTGFDTYDPNLRPKIYDQILQNSNYTSLAVKLAGLVTFQNVIIVCMICVATVLLIFIVRYLYQYLEPYVSFLIVNILLNKYFLYVSGLSIAIINMICDPTKIENHHIRQIFIFDWLTPLFGCGLFGIVGSKLISDLMPDAKNDKYFGIGMFITIVWTSVAIYHLNWLVGVASIIMLFFTCGFMFGTTSFGYYSGFDNNKILIRCLIVSICLNIFMLWIKIGFISGRITIYATVFETGIYFWGSIVGSVAILILSNLYRTDRIVMVAQIMCVQILTAVYYLGMIYIGNILSISNYKAIGGTFLVLWSLDLERTILQKYNRENRIIMLSIVLANLYIVKQLITLYPGIVFGYRLINILKNFLIYYFDFLAINDKV